MKVFLSPSKPKTTVIEHEVSGQQLTLEFNNNTLAKTAFVIAVNDENPIYTHLNRYLATLPVTVRNDIFDITAQIQEVIEGSATLDACNEGLRTLFNHLFHRISFDAILNLVRNNHEFNKDITMPSSEFIKMEYEGVSDNYTKEKTYTLPEYQELIAMIIQLRIMFPIWAHYIEIYSHALGTEYKEHEAFKLIMESPLYNSVAMQKLSNYVKANTPEEGSKAAIINGISSETYPEYNLAMVVVRKICTMEIRNPGERHPVLVMHISTHVREKITNNDKKSGSIIADKIGQDTKASSEERQISMMERFKIRDRLTVGQRVFLIESVSDPYVLAEQLKPGISRQLVRAMIGETNRMEKKPVENVQKIILRNMISTVAPNQVVTLMKRDVLVKSLAVCAAVLVEEGFTEIAQFCTATTVPAEGNATIATDQHQNKVTSELRERTDALMPFQKSGRSKTAVSPIANNIDMIFKEITSKVWHSNLPENIIAPNGGPVIRRIKIPGNLRIRLTEWAIYVASRSSPTQNVEDKLNSLNY
jgi:hypothetical protein